MHGETTTRRDQIPKSLPGKSQDADVVEMMLYVQSVVIDKELGSAGSRIANATGQREVLLGNAVQNVNDCPVQHLPEVDQSGPGRELS
jgi:hypothetical protein